MNRSKNNTIATIGVVGAGAFGTALAIAAARAGRSVRLWGRDALQMQRIASSGLNADYLPGVMLPPEIIVAPTLADIAVTDAILLATPAQSTRSIVTELSALQGLRAPLIICAKGIERGSGAYPSAIAAEILPALPIAVLSGPSFAQDVAVGLPTAVVLAAQEAVFAQTLAQALNSSRFRVYHATDRRGVEIGGAAKNVLAIAIGIVEARGLGDSAKAALIARGFAEMRRFAIASGAEAETIMGLSGLGDLVLTCGSDKSRNFRYGVALGGKAVSEGKGKTFLSEGAEAAAILVELADRLKVDMPICAAVAAIIAGSLAIDEAIEMLISRPQKAE